MNWYLKAFSQYATFNGRAQRAEFWYFHLFWIVGLFAMMIIGGVLDSIFSETGYIAAILVIVFAIINAMPMMSVTIRRLHDINKSGWWYLIYLVPYIGTIMLFIFSSIDSKEDNIYGENPKTLEEF